MQGKIFLTILSLILIGCQAKKNETFIAEGYRVEGSLDHNRKLEGHIKFYDTIINNLMMECDYKNGIKNGEYKEYHKNGMLKVDLFYSQDLENGIAKFFDSSGSIIAKDYYYFGLRSGNATRYKSNKLKTYSFYSLENQELIHFDYDSLKGKHLPDLFSEFFYYTHSNFRDENSDIARSKTEYFLYTPNPPFEEFTYSLVKVDKSLKIQSTIIEFDKNKPWSKFDYDSNLKTINSSVAIKLVISDSINNIDIEMLKVLN